MTVRKIHTRDFSSDLLSNPSEEVVEFDDELRVLVDDLLETLHFHKIAIGFAAPQIGISKRVAVINLKNDEMDDLILVNPKILREFGKKDVKMESCMSVPHLRGPVEMRKSVELEFQDLDGNLHKEVFRGFLARAVRHEVDHLNGMLYTDHVGSEISLEKVTFYKDSGFTEEHIEKFD